MFSAIMWNGARMVVWYLVKFQSISSLLILGIDLEQISLESMKEKQMNYTLQDSLLVVLRYERSTITKR